MVYFELITFLRLGFGRFWNSFAKALEFEDKGSEK
jgi:hypothetical protein